MLTIGEGNFLATGGEKVDVGTGVGSLGVLGGLLLAMEGGGGAVVLSNGGGKADTWEIGGGNGTCSLEGVGLLLTTEGGGAVVTGTGGATAVGGKDGGFLATGGGAVVSVGSLGGGPGGFLPTIDGGGGGIASLVGEVGGRRMTGGVDAAGLITPFTIGFGRIVPITISFRYNIYLTIPEDSSLSDGGVEDGGALFRLFKVFPSKAALDWIPDGPPDDVGEGLPEDIGGSFWGATDKGRFGGIDTGWGVGSCIGVGDCIMLKISSNSRSSNSEGVRAGMDTGRLGLEAKP